MYLYSLIRRVLSKVCLVSAVAFLLLSVVAPLTVRAQEAPSRAATSSASHTAAPTAEKQPSGEAKEESKENAEESGEDALRHSYAVRLIAKYTGMSVNMAYWVCVILNFSIVAGAIFVVARKRLPGVFKSRTELIQKRIEEARKTSEEARRRLTEVEGRLSRLDVEITEMRREADENAQSEERRIRAAVEEERKRIVESAEQEISTIANAARRDLKAYAGALAVDLAEKKIRVGKETDQSLVREFTTRLGKDGE